MKFLNLTTASVLTLLSCAASNTSATVDSEIAQLRQELESMKAQMHLSQRHLQEHDHSHHGSTPAAAGDDANQNKDDGMTHDGGHNNDNDETPSPSTQNTDGQEHDHSQHDHGDHNDATSNEGNGATTAADDADMNHGDHNEHSTGGHGSGHVTQFSSGKDGVAILFSGWENLSWGEYIGSCIFVIFLGVLVEAITTYRILYRQSLSEDATFASVATPAAIGEMTEKTDEGLTASSVSSLTKKKKITTTEHLVKTALYLVGVTLSYALMLIVMTMNVGIFICGVLGLTIGYFFFGPARAQAGAAENDAADCCHSVL